MKPSELKPSESSRHNRKRIGRDTSSGYGKTAGRGQKGQLACTGSKTRLGFEGGQIPLSGRMSKRGFRNVNRREYATIDLSDLNRFDDGSKVATSILKSSGSVKKELARVRLLANGELKVKLTVKANKVSETVKKTVEAAGRTVEVI